MFVYLYARYKSLTDNPAILNHIESTKAGINRFLHDLSNQNSTVLLRAQRRGLMRYGLIGLGLSVLLLLVPGSQHYQLPVLWLTALSFLSVWESFCLEWVFEHRTAYKDYAKAYAVVALFPLLVFVEQADRVRSWGLGLTAGVASAAHVAPAKPSRRLLPPPLALRPVESSPVGGGVRPKDRAGPKKGVMG